MDSEGRSIRFSARVNFESRELQIVIFKRKQGDAGTYILKPISLQDPDNWHQKGEGEMIERSSIAIPFEDVERFLADMQRDVPGLKP